MSGDGVLRALRSLWVRHRYWMLPALVTLMAIVAVLKLGSEFGRLLFWTGPKGAIDLRQLQRWVGDWFSGRYRPLYYPPATYVMLWPLVGWVSYTSARWLWAATSILVLAASVLLSWRITNPKTQLDRWFVALLLLSLIGTGVTIGNGQVILHILPALLGCMLLLERGGESFAEDFLAAALVTWALMKPTVSAPFFWVILFAPKRWRPALLVLAMYSVLTVVAAAFRQESLLALIQRFIASASDAATFFAGTRNIHALFITLGWQRWMGLASIIILVALGVWIFRNRRADLWVLVGVAALVARMWTYHRVYDDVLIVLPELALFRIATQSPSVDERTIAGTLVGLTAVAMLCPASLLDEPSPWAWLRTSGHVMLWFFVLAYLVYYAQREFGKVDSQQTSELLPDR